MPKGNGKRRGPNKDSNAKGNPADKAIVAAHHAAARGDYLFDAADLGRRPQSMLLTQHPPKKIQDQIHWVQTSTLNLATLPAGPGGSLLEFNQAFQIGSIPFSSAWVSVYDQYCIYSVMVRITAESTGASSASLGRITTAIDYDSVQAVGSETSLLGFASAISSELTLGKSYERYIKPCVTLNTGTGPSTTVSGSGVARLWLDSAFSSIPHYGFRAILAGNLGNTCTISMHITWTVGFRNSY